MSSRTLAERVRDELLPFVRQPAQYLGGEVNQLVQPGQWEAAALRVALAFPDLYAVGMSHLGLQILYGAANAVPGVCAERVFAPAPDAEALLRRSGLPLFTWDTRQAVGSADLLAFSLQTELAFTSVLNLLDLAGVPVRAAERDDTHPLVLAGGPQADNPEPLAEFLDLVIVGDGEVALPALLTALREMKAGGLPRRACIAALAERFPWVYAPGLYAAEYHADGTLATLRPTRPGLPERIERCIAPDLEALPYPRRPLVPWTPLVHERLAIEIMRGCPNLCRFCHAGYTKRPVRWRSVENIVALAEEGWAATGFDELGLLSLSTSDYPELVRLAEALNARFAGRMVNLSFPSLRVDQTLALIPALGSSVRRGALTLAVEAAAPELRAALRKEVAKHDLLAGVRAAYAAGWNRIKLYFMAGFPGERPEDLDGIFDLSYAVSYARREVGKPPAAVTSAVGWLVPKPFTPLQWAPQPPREYFFTVIKRVRERAQQRRSAVRLRFAEVDQAVLEGVLARGDRRLGAAVAGAWRRGARLEGWRENFDLSRWRAAWQEAGLDPVFYAERERGAHELLPWAHIGNRLGPELLAHGWQDYVAARGVAKLCGG
ncbi:MAG: TIGR03960 family B12-binding radical SAM protein [Phycisphaerales bacterium]|nr:TIGR03960 family B12-binding radical SAM protein [Phycisphaerales bacterium]